MSVHSATIQRHQQQHLFRLDSFSDGEHCTGIQHCWHCSRHVHAISIAACQSAQITLTSTAAPIITPLIPQQAPDKETLESWTYKDAQGNHVPANKDTIKRWQDGLQQCFKYAIDRGIKDIHVLGHFDPLHPVLLRPTTWRNLMNIGPNEKATADGLSYADVMIKPVTSALAAVAAPGVSLWFSVSGEMGLSNFLNAKEWKAVLDQIRTQLRAKPWQVTLGGLVAGWVGGWVHGWLAMWLATWHNLHIHTVPQLQCRAAQNRLAALTPVGSTLTLPLPLSAYNLP